HRMSVAPLKYEVPQELRGNGSGLQDLVWQTYLGDTQQDPNTDRSHVTIDGIAWEPDSHRVTLSVAPLASKDDTALPEPWTCFYDVTTKQIVPSAEVAEGPATESSNDSAPAPSEEATTEQTEPASSAAETADLEGERFRATREDPIT